MVGFSFFNKIYMYLDKIGTKLGLVFDSSHIIYVLKYYCLTNKCW